MPNSTDARGELDVLLVRDHSLACVARSSRALCHTEVVEIVRTVKPMGRKPILNTNGLSKPLAIRDRVHLQSIMDSTHRCAGGRPVEHVRRLPGHDAARGPAGLVVPPRRAPALRNLRDERSETDGDGPGRCGMSLAKAELRSCARHGVRANCTPVSMQYISRSCRGSTRPNCLMPRSSASDSRGRRSALGPCSRDARLAVHRDALLGAGAVRAALRQRVIAAAPVPGASSAYAQVLRMKIAGNSCVVRPGNGLTNHSLRGMTSSRAEVV